MAEMANRNLHPRRRNRRKIRPPKAATPKTRRRAPRTVERAAKTIHIRQNFNLSLYLTFFILNCLLATCRTLRLMLRLLQPQRRTCASAKLLTAIPHTAAFSFAWVPSVGELTLSIEIKIIISSFKRISFNLIVLAFGLGAMIYIGLEFGSFFEIPFDSPCHHILIGVNPLLQMIFSFMQMYFIFLNARVSSIQTVFTVLCLQNINWFFSTLNSPHLSHQKLFNFKLS